MAKIDDLQVTKLKIADSAITAFATGTGSLAVANTYGMPTQVYVSALASYSSPINTNSGSATLSFYRNGFLIKTETANFFGNTGSSALYAVIDWSYCDTSPSGTVTYSVASSANVNDPLGSCGINVRDIYATWEKV